MVRFLKCFEVELVEFTCRLDLRQQRGIKSDSRILGLSKLQGPQIIWGRLWVEEVDIWVKLGVQFGYVKFEI